MPTADYVSAIRERNLSIYDSIEVGDPDLWIPAPELEELLREGLCGLSVEGMPIKTRSKWVSQKICETLGYAVPSSFKKVRPRFLGQQFEKKVQKSNNVQIWNDEIAPSRRYVLISVSEEDVVDDVKVVTGETLAELDTTGTLTGKYQARLTLGESDSELVSSYDTSRLAPLLRESGERTAFDTRPTDYPETGDLLPVESVFERLLPLVEMTFSDPGFNQGRERSSVVHRRICELLGYDSYHDDGRFPDVTHQLLEVKLQTATTIDLGIALPSSEDPLGLPKIGDVQPRFRDVRYAILYGSISGADVTLSHLYVMTGADFFSRFEQFGGKELNQKIQIHLPDDFFE